MSLLRYGDIRKTAISQKFQNFGTNIGKITHINPLIREFYNNGDSRVWAKKNSIFWVHYIFMAIFTVFVSSEQNKKRMKKTDFFFCSDFFFLLRLFVGSIPNLLQIYVYRSIITIYKWRPVVDFFPNTKKWSTKSTWSALVRESR